MSRPGRRAYRPIKVELQGVCYQVFPGAITGAGTVHVDTNGTLRRVKDRGVIADVRSIVMARQNKKRTAREKA